MNVRGASLHAAGVSPGRDKKVVAGVLQVWDVPLVLAKG